jgi:hypothetical protein
MRVANAQIKTSSLQTRTSDVVLLLKLRKFGNYMRVANAQIQTSSLQTRTSEGLQTRKFKHPRCKRGRVRGVFKHPRCKRERV